MDAALQALVAAAAASAPQNAASMEPVQGRVLGVDGDGLAYYCAGKEDTPPGVARAHVIDKIRAAAAACGATVIKLYLTGRGSHKGGRYAVARVKPYQGQRDGGNRPANWEFLREFLETYDGSEFTVEIVHDREADDCFSRDAALFEDYVIFTQDKDMRMVYGKHLDWVSHILYVVSPDQFGVVYNDKLYGGRWFWSQMLHGDTADAIPGLPFYTDGSVLKTGPKKGQTKEIRCGEASEPVKTLLPIILSHTNACVHIRPLYESCYGERWLVEMLEQGILLWMRKDVAADPFNVCEPGNPLHALTQHDLFPIARAEIEERLKATYDVTIEDDGSRNDAERSAHEAGREVRAVSAPLHNDGGGARPRPLDGGGASDPAPGLQQPARQGGEQPQAVRRPQPVGVPAWLRHVSAAAR